MSRLDAFSHVGAWSGIVGPILFVTIFTADGFITPGYSARDQAISFLEVTGPNGWIQVVNFAILGILLAIFGLGFRRMVLPVLNKTRVLLIASILLVVSALGYDLAAIFQAPRPGESPYALHVAMHSIAFSTIFISLGIACFLIGYKLLRIEGWRGLCGYSIFTGIISIVPGAFNLASFGTVSSFVQAVPYSGVANRVLVVLVLAWYVMLGLRILRARNKSAKSI